MTFPPKQPGRCLRCQTDVYEVRAVHPDGHPLAGEPSQLGPALESATQVRFLLSNGSVADVTFCLDCARALTPADYAPIWAACLARNDRALALAGRSAAIRRTAAVAGHALVPLAIVGRRRTSPDGLPMLDRR